MNAYAQRLADLEAMTASPAGIAELVELYLQALSICPDDSPTPEIPPSEMVQAILDQEFPPGFGGYRQPFDRHCRRLLRFVS